MIAYFKKTVIKEKGGGRGSSDQYVSKKITMSCIFIIRSGGEGRGGGAEFGLKDEMQVFPVCLFLKTKNAGSSIGSVSAWHASSLEFDRHIWHILS